MDFKKLAQEVQEKVVAFRRDLHMNPEPSLQEFRTTKQIAAALDELGVSYRLLDPTGVIAEVHGTKGAGRTIALRGDIDALSIQEETGLPYASQVPGMMHACGHDTHAAMLLGSVMVLNKVKDQFAGTVRFIFQPAEEVGAGAPLAIKQGCLEGVDGIYGVHIGSQKAIGKLSSGAGPHHAAADHYFIRVRGAACHGAGPHKGRDATVCGAAIVMALQTMVSREFDPMIPVVVTVGSFHSGSRFNIVSGYAELEGTIRSIDPDVHDAIPGVLKRIAEETAAAYGCTAEVEYEVLTNVLVNDAVMVEKGMAAARKVTDLVEYDSATMGGEDFAEYTKIVPGAFFRLGAGGEYPGHSDHYCIDETAFATGVAFYAQAAYDFLTEE